MKIISRALAFFLLAFLSSALTFHPKTEAARVYKVTNKTVFIELDGESPQVDDVYVLLDAEGKRRGLVKIKVMKNGKAKGLLGKGRAEEGWTAQFVDKTKTAGGKKRRGGGQDGAVSSVNRSYWGAMVGLGMNKMSVDVDNNADSTADVTESLSGMSFAGAGLFDYGFMPQLWFRGLAGLRGLKAEGGTQVGCSNSTCSVDIYYISVDLWGRFLFATENFRPWIGGGFSLMFPATKTTTALQSASVTNTSILALGGGFDWFVSPTLFIPFQIEYGMLPKSQTVEASQIMGRIGFGIPF